MGVKVVLGLQVAETEWLLNIETLSILIDELKGTVEGLQLRLFHLDN